MIQPNKNKRKTVPGSQYDAQFEILNNTVFPNLELPAVDYEGQTGILSTEDLEEYSRLDINYIPGVDLQKKLAENQGNLEKIANVAFRGVLGATVAAVEPFAYLMDVSNHIAAIEGADRDYSNYVTKGLTGIEDWAREVAPIYTAEEEPDILTSSDWWFQNFDQVMRSAGYLVPGSALFKGTSILGKGLLGQIAKATGSSISGTAGAQVLNAGSALGSATMLNYSEHAKSAELHIKENVDKLTGKYVTEGLDPKQAEDKAKRVLSEQAADIIKGGRINILWQSISQANLFRGIGHTRRFGVLKENVKGQGLRTGFEKLGIESLTEAAEEVTTGFYESEAQYALNRELDKEVKDYSPGFERFAEHLTSHRGITEGLLGALGSVPMTVGSSIMEKKSNVDALEQIKNTVAKTGASGERLKDLNKKQLRELALMNALKGTSGNFMEMLEIYKNASPEEAERLGFEENYKELADEYIKDAKFIEDVINNELMNPVRGNQAEAFILVNHKLNEYYALQDIENYKSKIIDLEAKREKLFTDIENNVEDKSLHSLRNKAIERDALKRTIKAFEQSLEELQKNNLPMTRETSETLAGEQKNLEDASKKLESLEAELGADFLAYSNNNELTAEETTKKIQELESAGDLDIQIEINKSLLEGAKIRRNNNTNRYQELVTNPEILKKEGKEAIKRNKAAQEKKAAERKAKQKTQKQQQTKAAKKKTAKTTATPKANAAQTAAGGTPLTATSPLGKKGPVNPNQINTLKDLEKDLEIDGVTPKFGKFRDNKTYKEEELVKDEETGELIPVVKTRVKATAIKTRTKNVEINGKTFQIQIELYDDGTAIYRVNSTKVRAGVVGVDKSLSKAEFEAEIGAAAKKGSTSSNQVFESPILDGNVSNGGEDIESNSEINDDNSKIVPKSFNPYFEINEDNQRGRQTNSASSLAFLSIPYRQIEVDGRKENKSLSNKKTDASKLVESNKALLPGSEVTLKLVNGNNIELSKDELSVMDNKDVDNLAVAVYQNGKKVASLHTTKWIEAIDSNGNLLNTAPGELEEQIAHAKNIRRAIARNANENNELKSTVEFKGHGLILPLFAEDSATGDLLLIDDQLQKVNKSIDQALPDVDNIELGVVNGGEIYTGEFALKEETVIDIKDANYTNGRVVANLPTTNGKIFPTILFVDKVTEEQANTIIGAAVSFQNDQTETFDSITEATNIEFGRDGDSQGLHKFVNRYVYSPKAFYSLDVESENKLSQRSILVYTPEMNASEDGQVQGMLQIIDVDSRVMYTNDPMFFQNNPQFVTENNILDIRDLRDEAEIEEASELLQNKLVNIKTDAINKPGEFKDVILDVEGNVKDVSTHSSYNAFKGQFLKTDINGTNFIENADGTREYTYMTQPLIVIDTSFAEENVVTEEAENADDIADGLSFASPIMTSEEQDENQIELYKEDAITRAMQLELSERFFDTKIISLTQQVEAIDSIFATYAQNITKADFKKISAFVKKGLQAIVDTKQTRKYKKAGIQHLLDNFDAKSGKITVEGLILEKLAKLDILPQKQGFRTKELTDAQIDQIFAESLEADGFTQEDFVKDIYDFEFYKTNKKRTASSGIKLLLSTVTKSEKSWLGGKFNKAIPYQESYDTIKATLSRVPGTFKDQLKALQERSKDSDNPVFKKVINLLQNDSETLRRQFVVAMSGTRLDFVFLKIDNNSLGAKSQVMQVDRYNTTVNIKNKWFRNLLDSKLTKNLNVDGIPEVIIDQKYRKKLQNDYREVFGKYKAENKLATDEFITIVKKYLQEMGVGVPFEGLKFLATKASATDRSRYLRRKAKWSAHVDPDLTTSGFPQGMMSSLFKSFRTIDALTSEKALAQVKTDKQTREEIEKIEGAAEILLEAEARGGFIHTTNPYDGPNYEKVVYGLLGLTVDFEGSIYGDSFRDSKGNMIYPYQNHFGISRLLSDYITNPEELNNLLSLSYNKNSRWGKGLQKNENYLELLMFDATNFNGNNTNRKEQGKFLQEVTLFNAFANQGNADGYFFPITTADKDVAPVIKAPKLKDVVSALKSEKGVITDIKDSALEQIYAYAIDEYNRIQNYEFNENFNRGPYEKGAGYFYMFHYLNAYTSEDVDVLSMDEQEAITYIRETVKQNVIQQINNHVERLQELGVTEKFLDSAYLRKNFRKQKGLFATKADQFAGAIAEYNLNYIVSNNEVVKLFGNDPAHAYKKSKKEGATVKDHVKETLNNYEKRKADLISPASTPQYTVPTVTIATAIDAETENGVERTDAQEYGTIQEMLESKLSSGKLPKDIVDRILEAYKAAKADPNNVRNFFKLSDVLTKEEINKYKKVMMADKPVFVQNDIRTDLDSNNKLFRKSSIRYLWPEETTGYGLDNIRVAMENTGIDRLGHLSSDKTGAVNPISIYDEDGKVKSLEEVTAEMQKSPSRSLSRSGLGIQQEKGSDTGEISYSTQLDVLLFDDMLGKSLSTGESYSDLRDQKEALQIRFMQLGAKQMFTKLGIKQNPDGSTYIPNPTTLAKMLREEAISRNWTAKDISELALKDVEGSVERVFKSPLTFNHARKNIDSLVLSLINKAVTKLKMPGESLVQASSAGFESKGAVSWDQFTSDGEFDKVKNGITLLQTENAFDETKGLQGTRIKNGKLLPAQILINPIFKDSKGNTIDLTSKKYTTITNGVRYLREDVLPQELKERILYRIPGQGKPSVSATEIVGFLPKTSTSTIIVADDIIDQMGSDFDWDTAYTYFKQYSVNERGEIQVKSDLSELEQLQDEYYDLFKKIIFDPVTFKATDKLDNTDLKQAADLVDSLTGKESEINDPSYVTTNIDNTISQRTGKQLIGPASLSAVMHAALQGKGITINVSSKTLQPIPFVFFKGGKKNIDLELTTISSYAGKSYATALLEEVARSASDNIRTVQNAAVDNANEAVLGRAGINNATIDVALFALMYKDTTSAASIHAEQLVYFLRQEAVEMYTTEFDFFSAQTEGGFRTEEQIRNDAFNATMTKLAEKAGIEIEEDYTSSLDEYRMSGDGSFRTFSSQDFIDQFRTSNNPNPSYYRTQMAILAGFKQLQNSSDPVRKLQRGIMSPRTKGMGSTIFEAQRTIDNMEEIFEKGLSSIGGLENLQEGQLREMYDQFDSIYQSLSNILPFSNPAHKQLINLWQQFTGAENVSQKTREQLFDALLNKSFGRAFERTFNEDITEARHRLTSNPEDNIATRLMKVQASEFGKRNLFISRLIPINANAGIPASISYINSKQDDISDQMSVDLVALYESVEEGHRELFEDIVKYTYIFGGVQSAGNFSKFMNTAYLDEVGFYDALREEEKALNSVNSPEAINTVELMVEFLQHNPHRAITLNKKDLQKIAASPTKTVVYGNRTLNYEFELNQPDSGSEYNRVLYQDDDGNRIYIEVIGIEGNLETELFQKMGVNEAGNVVFRRIGKKGYQTSSYAKVSEYGGINKYTSDGRLISEESILPKNNVPKPGAVNVGIPQAATTQPVQDVSIYGLDPVSMKPSAPGRQGVKELLDNLIADTDVKSFNALSRILAENLDTKGRAIKEVLIEDRIVSGDAEAYGQYRSGSVVISRETLTRYPDKLQETVLHEILHGFLAYEIKNPDSDFSRKIKYLTAASKKAFEKAVEKGEIVEGSVEYQNLEYAFNNPQEFVTNVMTKRDVQSFLNTLPGKKGLWQRFKDIVKDFLKQLGADFLIDINKDSLLAEAVNDIMSFIIETPSTQQTQQVVTKAAENAAGVFPLNPNISESEHVIASYGRMAAGEYTQQEFTEAIYEYRGSNLFSPVFTSKSKDKDVNTTEEILSVYKERAAKLKGKITDKVLKTAEGKKMQERLNRYEDQILSLTANTSFGNLDKIMTLQLGWAESVANSKNPTNVEIKEALNIVDMYDYSKVTKKYLDVKDRKSGNRFDELLRGQSASASGIKVRLIDKLTDMAVEIINAEMPEETIAAEDLQAIKEEGIVKSGFLDISKFNHPLVRTLDKYLKLANRNADSEIQALFLNIETEMDNIKNHPAFKNDPNLFFQKDNEGKLTGYFISPYSSDFNNAKSKIFKKYYAKVRNSKSVTSKNLATSVLFRELNRVEVAIDVRWFADDMGVFNSPFKSKEEYVEYLTQELGGESQANEMINQATEKYKKYKQLEDQKMLDIELEVSGSAGNLQEYQEEINSRQKQYKERYSPIYHLDSRYGGSKAIAKNKGYKAVVTAPLNKPKYYDTNYQNIQNDPQLKAFYDFYMGTMKDLMTLLPEGLVATLPENFFPFAKKGFVEQVSNDGVSAIFGAMKGSKIADYLFNIDQEVDLNPQIATKGVRNPETGEIEKNIPVRMLRGDVKEKSYDIEKVMKMFAAMSASYDYKSKVEDKILLLQRVLREAEEIQMDSKGDPMRKKIARRLKIDSKAGGLKNTQAAVKYAIDSNLYGVTKDTVEKGVVFSQEVEKIKLEFENLKTQLKEGKIDDSTYLQEKSELDKQLKKLGKKPKSLKKPLERLLEYTQLKGLGWNLMSGVNNLSFGTIANFVHAAGNEDYTTEQLTKAYGMLLKEYVPGVASKAQNLAEKYGILFEQLDAYYGKGNTKKKYKYISKLNPFQLQTSTEYMNQIAPFIAKMLNTKIDENGNTLWDMYDKEGNVKKEFKGLESEWTTKLDAETQNKFTAFRDASIEMNKVNHGNYDPNSALLIKREIWGRIGTQFRTWAFEGFNTRWGEKVYNAQLGRYTEGRYKAYKQTGIKGSIAMFAKSILNTLTLGFGVSEKSMRGDIKDDLTYANMRKNISSFKFWLAIMGAGLLLKGLAEDEDDDESKKLYTLLINSFYRLEQDGEFYANPGTAAEVLRNPAPIMKTLRDISAAANATYDYAIDSEGYEESRRDPVSKKWMKTVPFGNSIRSLDYLMETQIEKD